jgi:NADPH-dependent ferric siderophore reductase
MLTMTRKNQHVIPGGDGWSVVGEGDKRPTATFTPKREAIDAGRELAHRLDVDLVVHGRNGQALYSADAPRTVDEYRLRDAVRSVSAETKTATAQPPSGKVKRAR